MMYELESVRTMLIHLSNAFAIVAAMLLGGAAALDAQQSVCGPDGYRVAARHWDAVLKRQWESREACEHPGWPLRLAAISSDRAFNSTADLPNLANAAEIGTKNPKPLLVKAGDVVRVWMQGDRVRIEMSGTVERSAHQGEPVVVQITRHDDETGLTVQRVAGTVSGADEVEMEQ
jgi:hypothetical protein